MVFAKLAAAVVVAANIASTAALVTRTTCPDGTTIVKNAACCKWATIRDLMISQVFEGICGEDAHSTVRIAFHDAAGFSVNGGAGNGADGSIIAFGNVELLYPDNAGIDDIVSSLQPFADANGISYGDVIQFGSSVALSLCPGAPRVQTFVGRPNATVAATSPGSLPAPSDSIDSILALFADKGFNPAEVVALIASHSIAAQDEIEPAIHGSPFDSTPSEFDSQVFLETLLKGTLLPGDGSLNTGQSPSGLEGEFTLQSDHLLARDPRTACTWQSFVGNQALMASAFARAMAKLALLGQNVHELTDCTEVIGIAPSTRRAAFFPAGTNSSEIEASCSTAAFPKNLSTQAGTMTAIPVVPTQ